MAYLLLTGLREQPTAAVTSGLVDPRPHGRFFRNQVRSNAIPTIWALTAPR